MRIPCEFHARVSGVHTLTTGAGRPGEPPGQFRLGDRQPGRDSQARTMGGRHASIMLFQASTPDDDG